MTPYIGEIRMFAGNFAPRDWLLCDGSLLSVGTYNPLFALLGTTYGGDGVNTFALPDLRGRIPVGFGQGAGLSNYNLGQRSGTETVTLTTPNLPAHTHALMASTAVATSAHPSTNVFAKTPGTYIGYLSPNPPAVAKPLAPASVGVSGAGMPHDNVMPGLCLNYIIVTTGIFPMRA